MRCVFLSVSAALSLGSIPAAAQSDGVSSSEPGQDIYKRYCAACHAPSNIMVAAPKLHDEQQWRQRLEDGFDGVLDRAINGFGAMPPLGTCVSCSHEDIEAALRYMAAPALSAVNAEE